MRTTRKGGKPNRSRLGTGKRRSKEMLLAELPPLAIFVRERRAQLGYSQEQLAFRSGLNLRFIREFELGKETVRLDKVNQLLSFIGAELKVELKNAR